MALLLVCVPAVDALAQAQEAVRGAAVASAGPTGAAGDAAAAFEELMAGVLDKVDEIKDLIPGMVLEGTVTNVAAFGAFVDIGVHQDGLVHISELADRYVKVPSDVVKVHQRVKVTVLDVDLPRKRIALSLKTRPDPAAPRAPRSGPGTPGDARRPGARPMNAARMPTNDWFSLALSQGKK